MDPDKALSASEEFCTRALHSAYERLGIPCDAQPGAANGRTVFPQAVWYPAHPSNALDTEYVQVATVRQDFVMRCARNRVVGL